MAERKGALIKFAAREFTLREYFRTLGLQAGKFHSSIVVLPFLSTVSES